MELQDHLRGLLDRTSSTREQHQRLFLEDGPYADERYRNERRIAMRIGCTDPDFSIRLAATEELGFIGKDVDAQCIRDRLEDDDGIIRATAASALGTLIETRAKRDLIEATKDPFPLVRRYAWVALWDVFGQAVSDDLRAAYAKEKSDIVLVSLDGIFASLGDEDSLAKIQAYAHHPDPHISSPAREALVKIDEGKCSQN